MTEGERISDRADELVRRALFRVDYDAQAHEAALDELDRLAEAAEALARAEVARDRAQDRLGPRGSFSLLARTRTRLEKRRGAYQRAAKRWRTIYARGRCEGDAAEGGVS